MLGETDPTNHISDKRCRGSRRLRVLVGGFGNEGGADLVRRTPQYGALLHWTRREAGHVGGLTSSRPTELDVTPEIDGGRRGAGWPDHD
jgi:hypothetical protein